MSTTSGLTRRRGGGGSGAGGGPSGSNVDDSLQRSGSSSRINDAAPETSYESAENGHKIAFDPRDIGESAERSKQPKLTLMEEVILLGLKDKQVCLHKVTRNPNLSTANLVTPLSSVLRVISPSGMTTSHMPFEGALLSNLPSVAVSPW